MRRKKAVPHWEIKSIEQAFIECPGLDKITYNIFNDIFKEISNVEIDFKKTFEEHGFSELDCVYLVMKLESKLDINIKDNVSDFIFDINSKPDFLLQSFRNEKIDSILNNNPVSNT